jgi:hypothetical protein
MGQLRSIVPEPRAAAWNACGKQGETIPPASALFPQVEDIAKSDCATD